MLSPGARSLFVGLVLALSACGPPAASLRPVVEVIAPANGARIAQGERIGLRVSGAASAGIDRFEARLGSTLLISVPVAGAPWAASAVLNVLPPAAPNVTLSIFVVDRAGVSSDPVFFSINVAPGAATPVPAATLVTRSTACAANSAFVADVTIPDNTPVSAGQSFTKTWRLRNSGPCAWDLGYAFAFVDRDALGAPSSVLVGPAATGATFEVSVPFIAPATAGIYTSTWQLRNPDGKLFGVRVYAQIRVP
ncbi:MAG: NBR1-Ig-like domain-containing protein [Thermoflexales bacterium]